MSRNRFPKSFRLKSNLWGLVAALALGAQGIYMGIRFIATQESDFAQVIKKLSSKEAKEKPP